MQNKENFISFKGLIPTVVWHFDSWLQITVNWSKTNLISVSRQYCMLYSYQIFTSFGCFYHHICWNGCLLTRSLQEDNLTEINRWRKTFPPCFGEIYELFLSIVIGRKTRIFHLFSCLLQFSHSDISDFSDRLTHTEDKQPFEIWSESVVKCGHATDVRVVCGQGNSNMKAIFKWIWCVFWAT